ncbi:MAG: hypothetical protein JRG79_08575 [Deltaproteobacteria bacterium]|nr:hypothetical protein [Deltaproteobacteria bacterium]MBW1943270.1 hypothetical protein [Deltaproteobacteria bacterium]MBW2206953.1 hypothetical protein [Deltaproteobacteria bacterium]
MAQPEKRFKCGACEVAIFENVITTKDGRKMRIKKASFQKRYKTADGEWKSTNSLDADDIPKASLVLNEAYKYLAFNKDTENPNDM